MIVDRRNKFLFCATTSLDENSLLEWAKNEPFVHKSTVKTTKHEYKKYRILRTPTERIACGLYALVHVEQGRRFANRYNVRTNQQMIDLLARYPQVKEDLLDFQPIELDPSIEEMTPGEFVSFCRQIYGTAPTFTPINVRNEIKIEDKEVKSGNSSGIFVAYINVDQQTERKEKTEIGCASIGWVPTRISATTPDSIDPWITVSDFHQLPRTRQIEYCLSVSHLRALETFVETGLSWGLILEDDIDYQSVESWNFSLQDLPDVVPNDCGILQLMMSWPIQVSPENKIKLHGSESLQIQAHMPNRNWGTGAYLIRREYALDLLNRLKSNTRFDFSIYPGLPVADVWIYDTTYFSHQFRAYSTPLMYCLDVESTIQQSSAQTMHKISRFHAQNLAKQKGKIELKDVFCAYEPKDYPFVSIITPSYNRRDLLPLLEQCILRQTYPRCRMEWIIVDDSQDEKPLFQPTPGTGLNIRYIVKPEKMTIGAKRNYTLSLAKGLICVYMDDDDYYPATRVSHAVETLQQNPQVHVAGSTLMPIYYLPTDEYYLFGPHGSNHTTAGALAHRRLFLETQRYDDKASFAEEPSFLKNFQIPLVQLNVWDTITCISHDTNTVDKKKLLASKRIKLAPKAIHEVIELKSLETYKSKHASRQ